MSIIGMYVMLKVNNAWALKNLFFPSIEVAFHNLKYSLSDIRILDTNFHKRKKLLHIILSRLHTAFLHWPLSSAATKEVQGPDTT